MRRLKVGETYDYVGTQGFAPPGGTGLILGIDEVEGEVWYRFTPSSGDRSRKFTAPIDVFLEKYNVPATFYEAGKKYGFGDALGHYRIISVEEDGKDLVALARYVHHNGESGSFHALDEDDFSTMVEV